MQTLKNQAKTKFTQFRKKACVIALVFALMLQALAVPCLAAWSDVSSLFGGEALDLNHVINGIGKFEDEEMIAQLKKDMLALINKDLIRQIEDYQLTGEVGAILVFSDDSLIDSYANSKDAAKMTFAEYRASAKAASIIETMSGNQTPILNSLLEKNLISDVKHRYCNIVDGAFVQTTYENIEALCNVEGVERVIISNTYEAADAVENPVYVYDTGIFNSSNIAYTGKGTIVAVLDTGCDYTHTAFTSHTVASPLYSRDDIEAMLKDTVAYSYDNSLQVREVYYGNITGNKIAYGYDYADKDPDIMPANSSHGTHVAGIIAGKDDTITGVAIDAQLAIMKVFSDSKQGAEDGDILAALEDCVTLGVDAINMSLGSSCGFTREVDDDYKNDLYDRIEAAGISLIVAASNDYSSGFGSEDGNTNKTDNPDSATVGAPSTYNAALGVASINGNKDKYMYANGNREVFFFEAVDMGAEEYDFFDMLGISKENPYAEYEYVTIPGVGMAINYAGLNMEGKIALVQRGDISFEEKVQYAYEAGATAVIVYNNVFGDIKMTVGNDLKIPVVSIGKDDGDAMAALETGTIAFDFNNIAGPFMSDFSSWGPTPDLKLKPEITAHGGNIWSAIPGGGYEKNSGTSMAAPNLCGVAVLVRQYVKDKYPEMDACEVRDLVNQLLMSTATIALDRKGNPYSPRKQGAGIGDVEKSTTTAAYLYVDGMGKTKLELGDDPKREGVYKMSINLKNISDAPVSYTIGSIVMTESVSTSEPEYVAEQAYLLSNAVSYAVEGGTYEGGVVTVAAGQTAKVSVTVTLSDADKIYLNTNFENGMYIEGFLTFDNVDENGVDLNAPFLAFYGDWGEAPLFDLDFYEVETEAHNNAIDDDDKIKADYYASTPLGTYYYDYILPLGSYLYKMDEDAYTAIPAVREHAAVSYYADCISGIYGVFAGLLRGAKELNIQIVDTATGEVVWSETEYNCQKAHFSGVQYPYISHWDLPMVDLEKNEVFGSNNTKYEVTMTAKLDWESENRNSNDTFEFSFYIDYEAPTVTNATFRTEYDKARKENRYYVDIMVYDNHYVMAINPVLVYDFVDYDGETKKTYAGLTEYPIPVYQENIGEVTKVTLEITDYLDIITGSFAPDGITVYLNDYALNSNVCFIPFPNTESADQLEFLSGDSITLDIHQTFDLTKDLVAKDTTTPAEPDYLKGLTWTVKDPSIVAIKNGQIEALKTGQTTVSVTGSSWYYLQDNGKGEKVRVPVYKTIVINVTDQVADDPNSSLNVAIEKLKFDSYHTLFAFNSDIDYSAIGRTDSYNYFGASPSIEFYPSEKVQLHYTLEPWNLAELASDRYELKWTSSNPKVATVDENGIVTAEEEGKARITLQITIDGKTSLLAARCSVEVKSEFIIENRKLVAYKGKGGDVVIPDDEGIMIIGPYAFCHYTIDHELEVEKDENGYYDIDLKKTPLSNNTVTSVVVPAGVDVIDKYAFANCKALKNVTLPEDCTQIGGGAFSRCTVLENINLENVSIISDSAFYKCESLTCEDLGGIDLSKAYNIGSNAFAYTRIESVKLTNLGRCGRSAFANCAYLTDVELGRHIRLSENMFENTPIKTITVYGDSVANNAFKNCKSLESVVFESNMTYLGQTAFDGCTKLSSVTFKGTCEQIDAGAFNGCTSLKELTLPTGKVKIGNGAFLNSGLETLKLAPATEIVSIGLSVFESEDFTFDITGSELYELRADNAVYTKDGSTLVYVVPLVTRLSFTVPASVKTIADGAFASCAGLQTVTFEAGSQLETVGVGAFANCISLSKVEFPNRTITLGDGVFFNTIKLTAINLDMVAEIGAGAFEKSAIRSVSLSMENVVIGAGAFYYSTSLTSATIGAGATIGKYAFLGAQYLQSVTLLGDGVTVQEGAFADCINLNSFSFDKLSGVVAKYAFLNCQKITEVIAPAITELEEGAFANCTSLTTFKAATLEKIGSYVFAPSAKNNTKGDPLTTFEAPLLSYIGEGAFVACDRLVSIDLSNVVTIDASAFAKCTALKSVILSDKIETVEEYAFGECTALTNIDLSNIIYIGTGAFYCVPLPKNLVLNRLETLADQALVENEEHYIETVYAPNLKEIGDMAFAGCLNLKTFTAPKLETIGYGVFMGAVIEEFEIFSELRDVDTGIFEGSETFKAFYTTVNGEKVYDFEYKNVMIKDGVLYTVSQKGYVLNCYPSAKEGDTFTVADGTVRIEFGAAIGNKNIKTVILPGTMKFIGNFAFYGCDSLEKVVFNSYYAPVLEGTMNGERIEFTDSNKDEYSRFEELYFYDYFFRKEGKNGTYHWYSNFKTTINNATPITYVIPQNSVGYQTQTYLTFFEASEDEDSGIVMGAYAIAFIEAVEKLPEIVDRFDKALVDAAITAYNSMEGRESEMDFIDDSYFEKFHSACREYNVDEATFRIARLYEMLNCKYSFDTLKDARAFYLSLSAEERELVANASVLDTKIAELSAVMGKEIDFSLSYEDHIDPVVEPVAPAPEPTPDPEPEKNNTWVIIVIVAAVVVLGAAAAVVVFLKKKKAPAAVKEAPATAKTTDENEEV